MYAHGSEVSTGAVGDHLGRSSQAGGSKEVQGKEGGGGVSLTNCMGEGVETFSRGDLILF